MSSVKKGVKGFAVNLLVQEITCDLKKDKMGTKMQVELSMLPGPNMYAAVKGGGNISGLNAKKPAADVKDLMLAIFKGVGQNVRKGLEGRIGQF